jgi:hypothetical protein
MSAFVASRTPEGRPGHCPACGEAVCLEPSWPSGDAPCPRCGNLVWFENRVEAIEFPDAFLMPNSRTSRLPDDEWRLAHPGLVELWEEIRRTERAKNSAPIDPVNRCAVHWEEMRRTERAKRLRRRRLLQGIWPGRVSETFSRVNSWVRSALVRVDWAGSPAYGAVWDPWLDS